MSRLPYSSPRLEKLDASDPRVMRMLRRIHRVPQTWRVTVQQDGREWGYALFSVNARACCLAWRARGARARARRV